MKKNLYIVALSVSMLALTGCDKILPVSASVSQSELLQKINRGESIEIEVATPLAEVEQGTEEKLEWLELALKTSNPDLRSKIEESLGIEEKDGLKYGVVYVNPNGEQDNNNTLRVALHNKAFTELLDDSDSLAKLADAAYNNYADLDADDDTEALYMAINGYFELTADNATNYANPDSTITRAEAMAMVMRAETPVSELTANTEFANAVGQSDFNIYAQEVVESNYLDLTSKSLNNMTYNGTITRAEAIYLLMNHYFNEELNAVDITTSTVAFSDAKDGGNIAEQQKFVENGTAKDYWKSYELTYALQNPDLGLPTDLYKALVVANSLGLVDKETRWDEGITKAEFMSLLVETLKLEDGIPTFNESGAAPEEHDYASEIKAREEEAAKQNALHRADPNYVAPPHTEIFNGKTYTVYGTQDAPCNKIPENLKNGDAYWLRAFGTVVYIVYHD